MADIAPKKEAQIAAESESEYESCSDTDSDSDGGMLMHASLTKEQKEIMRKNHMAIQARYKAAMQIQKQQKLADVVNACHTNHNATVSNEEAQFMLDLCKDDETEVAERLNTEHDFVASVREMMAQKKLQDSLPKPPMLKGNKRKRKRGFDPDRIVTDFKVKEKDYLPSDEDDDESDFEEDEEEESEESDYEEVYESPVRRRASKPRARKTNNGPPPDGPLTASGKVSGYNLDGSRRAPRLLLDNALKDTNAMASWSGARKSAWAQRKTNPNAYYYRFNDPGETQGKKSFTKAEEETFFKRLEEVGPDKWGIFAMKIPGRVGYQCSNFYRLLIKEGRIKDERYWFDDEGKLRFRRKPDQKGSKKPRRPAAKKKKVDPNQTTLESPSKVVKKEQTSSQRKVPPITIVSKTGPSKTVSKPRRPVIVSKPKAPLKKSSVYEKDEAFHCKVNIDPVCKSEKEPLPDFTDPITRETVVKPALSPYGHVMGYETWTRILRQDPKNTCPFTKKQLNRRMLIKLTSDNFEAYKDQILNL